MFLSFISASRPARVLAATLFATTVLCGCGQVRTGSVPAVGPGEPESLSIQSMDVNQMLSPFPASGFHVYATGNTNNDVAEFTPSGQFTAGSCGLYGPTAIAVDSAGKTFAVNYVSGTLCAYTKDGVETSPTILGLQQPVGLAVDSSGKFYVANYGNSSITTYTSAGVPTTPTITTGVSQPTAVAVDTTGKIYVVNGGLDSSVTTYTSAGVPTTPTITGIHYASAIAITANGNILVASNGTILGYTAAGQPSGLVIQTSFIIQGLAVAQNGDIYSTSNGQLETYTANGTATTPVISIAGEPYGVAVDKAKNIHVAAYEAETILEYTPSGNSISPTIVNGISIPRGVAVNSSGKIYVANSPQELEDGKPSGSSAITTYTSAGAQTTLTITTNVNYPASVAVDTSGKIYVLNVGPFANSPASLTTYTSAGVQTTPTITAGLSSPSAVAVDSNGKIYVTNLGTNAVTTYTPAGIQTSPTISLLDEPHGVAVDKDGKIYVTNYGNNSMATYKANGQPSTVRITSGVDGPIGVGIASNGDIYIANSRNGTITSYKANGTPIGSFQGLATPWAIAIH